jgi:hypothetical protein
MHTPTIAAATIVALILIFGFVYMQKPNVQKYTFSSQSSNSSALSTINYTSLEYEVSLLKEQNSNLSIQIQSVNKKYSVSSSNANSLYIKNMELSSAIDNLTYSNTELSNNIEKLSKIINLTEENLSMYRQEIMQPGLSYTHLPQIHITYAGYVMVNVSSSSDSKMYVSASWSNGMISYHNNLTVYGSNEVYFPVLPSNLSIIIGNMNSNETAESVTVTYKY